MEWTQNETLMLVREVVDSADPETAAVAIIGAMAGVLIHIDALESADEVLRNFTNDVEIRIRRPHASDCRCGA